MVLLSLRAVACLALLSLASLNASALTPPRPGHVFHDLAVGPNGELLVTHTDGVFRRAAGGSRWQRVLPDFARLLDAGSAGIYLLHGHDHREISHSRDVGATWTRTGATGGLDHVTAPGGTLLGCAGREIRASRDGGKVWTRLATVPQEAGSCRYMRLGPGFVYAAGGFDNWFSNRIGSDRWTRITGTIPPEVYVNDLFVDAAGALYVSTSGTTTPPDGRPASRVYRSRDGGATWDRYGVTREQTQHHVLAVDGLTVYLDCMGPQPDTADVCIWSGDAQMKTLRFTHSPGMIGPVVDSRLVTGADGVLYTIDMYGVHRWDGERKTWERLRFDGIPDPHTGVMR